MNIYNISLPFKDWKSVNRSLVTCRQLGNFSLEGNQNPLSPNFTTKIIVQIDRAPFETYVYQFLEKVSLISKSLRK